MASYHLVKQGEHLSGIAKEHGFSDFEILWEHPGNAELKRKRGNSNVLFPGDRVFVPDIEVREEPCATGKHHVFVVKNRPLMLRLKLEKGYSQPRANIPCDLKVDPDTFSLKTDGTGKVEHAISKSATSAALILKETLSVKDKKVPIVSELGIKIGHLDPVEEPTGHRARLANLGYYRVPLEELDEEELNSAIEEFQCEHGLTVDGILGPKSQAKLKQVHGC